VARNGIDALGKAARFGAGIRNRMRVRACANHPCVKVGRLWTRTISHHLTQTAIPNELRPSGGDAPAIAEANCCARPTSCREPG